jgi:hypothetical protein
MLKVMFEIYARSCILCSVSLTMRSEGQTMLSVIYKCISCSKGTLIVGRITHRLIPLCLMVVRSRTLDLSLRLLLKPALLSVLALVTSCIGLRHQYQPSCWTCAYHTDCQFLDKLTKVGFFCRTTKKVLCYVLSVCLDVPQYIRPDFALAHRHDDA